MEFNSIYVLKMRKKRPFLFRDMTELGYVYVLVFVKCMLVFLFSLDDIYSITPKDLLLVLSLAAVPILVFIV